MNSIPPSNPSFVRSELERQLSKYTLDPVVFDQIDNDLAERLLAAIYPNEKQMILSKDFGYRLRKKTRIPNKDMTSPMRLLHIYIYPHYSVSMFVFTHGIQTYITSRKGRVFRPSSSSISLMIFLLSGAVQRFGMSWTSHFTTLNFGQRLVNSRNYL